MLPRVLDCDRIEWMPAEASARRFGRLHRPQHFDVESAVVMAFARGTREAEVERVARATRLLAEAGLPVPGILACEPEQRWILQEDLGDDTLARVRSRGEPVAEAYSEAVGLLQRIGDLRLDTSPKPPLDRSRLRTELHQFATLALRLPEGPGASLAADFDHLLDVAVDQPQSLCHRDYHSRNLLLKDGRVRVIDHQDALVGPASYDRVSLAYDPYVALPDAVRDRVAGTLPGTSAVAVQRLAKAIGTFADKGGDWQRCIGPAARQAGRLIDRDALPCPVLRLAFASLAASDPAGSAVA